MVQEVLFLTRMPTWLSVCAAALCAFVILPSSADLSFGVSAAHADDHGGGDDDDDDDDDGRPRTAGGNTGDDDDDGPVVAPPRTGARPVQANDPSEPRPADARVEREKFRREILVIGLNDADLETLEAQGFVRLSRTLLRGTMIDLSRLAPPEGLGLEEAREMVRALPSGEEADLNHFYRFDEAASVDGAVACTHANCWAHEAVGWPTAAEQRDHCGPLPLIGVLDTGVNEDHELLSGALIDPVPMGSRRADPSRRIHGTAVVSVLAGQPGSRIEGLLPDARILVADVFERDGQDERTDVETLLLGLDLLAARGARVINLSLSGPENSVLARMVEWIVLEEQIAVVASVGNGGPVAEASYPAAIDHVIAVTAVDRRMRAYDRAQRGEHVDLAAPGVGLLLATSVSGAREKTGTSFATPFVTAAAALVLASDAELSPAEVAARLQAEARDLGRAGRDPVFGAGLLDMSGFCRG